MCGIIGIIGNNQATRRHQVKSALKAMELRGPDDCGIYEDCNITIGHRRLAIQDIENGHQPMTSADGNIIIAVNGEFYEHNRLRLELAKHYEFKSNSDSEILIALYLKYGYLGMMSHLRGEFAFILYDKKNNILITARDRFGIKPLCIYKNEEQIIIASKAKAILSAGIKAEWDQISLMQSLTMHYQPTDRTLFKNIKQVRPGHLLVISPNHSIQDIEYWDINYPRRGLNIHLDNIQEKRHINEFHNLLLDAVRTRLISDVPVCCHLSGGLDSSTVAGLMSHLRNEPIHCFSIVFPQAGREYDESTLAEETIHKCGGILHRIEVSQHDILTNLPDAVYHSEGLAVNGHLSCKYLLNKHIRECGFKVTLTGEGADECLAGYPHLRKDLFTLLPQSERERLTRRLYDTNLIITGTEIAMGDTLNYSDLEQRLGFMPSFLVAKACIGYKIYNLLTDEIRRQCCEHDFFKELLDNYDIESKLANRHPINQSLYLWNKLTLCNYILHTLGDGCEMSSSIEGRLPFLDHKLFEYAAKLPMQMKIKDYINEKYILKEAAKPYITNHIYQRQKHPFQAPPLTRCFSKKEFLQIYEELTSTEFAKMGIFNTTQVKRLLSSLERMSIVDQTAYEPAVMLMLTIFYFNQKLIHKEYGSI